MPGPWDQPPEEDDKDRQNGGSRAGRAVAIGLILVAGLVVGLVVMRGEALDDDSWARLIYLGLLLSVIVTGLSAGFVRNMRRSLRDIGIWLALGGGLLLVYSFADEFGMVADRLSGQVDPTSPRQMADGGVAITADERGHFVLRAQVEGAPVVFMVDTGASNVVLSHQAARAIGLDPDTLAYTQLTSTANGMGRSAPVTLSSIQVGDITLRDVGGSVNMADLDQSLLGMSFLSRLSGFSIESGELVLYR